MNYNVGDRLLCKISNDIFNITKDNYYVIIYIGSNTISLVNDTGNRIGYKVDSRKLVTYFYTLKEIRKLKLERINGL